MVTVRQKGGDGVELTQLSRWIVGVASTLLVASVGVGIGMWATLKSLPARVDAIDGRVEAILIRMSTLETAITTNTVNRLRDERVIEQLEKDVDAIKSTNHRPDSFTGAQGRELDRRIRLLEGQQ